MGAAVKLLIAQSSDSASGQTQALACSSRLPFSLGWPCGIHQVLQRTELSHCKGKGMLQFMDSGWAEWWTENGLQAGNDWACIRARKVSSSPLVQKTSGPQESLGQKPHNESLKIIRVTVWIFQLPRTPAASLLDEQFQGISLKVHCCFPVERSVFCAKLAN